MRWMMQSSQLISITISNVTKKYGKCYALRSLSANFVPGRLNLLIGENGSGKTTLLKCIMGLVRYEGSISVMAGKIGYAPEQYVMPSFMRVIDFLCSLGRVREKDHQRIDERIPELLSIFDFKSLSKRMIGGLSNGMKQKVNLLQALVHDPEILILDEPLHGLDLDSQRQFVELLKKLAKQKLIIVSTHYPERFRSKTLKTYLLTNGEIEPFTNA